MKVIWALGSLPWFLYSLPYVASDSWWRLLIAIGVSLALWEGLNKRPANGVVACAAAWAVLCKVALLGSEQSAPVFDWPPAPLAYTWTSVAFLVAGFVALVPSPRAAAALGLIGIMWGTVQLFGMWPMFDIVAELLYLAAVMAIWSDGNGGTVRRIDFISARSGLARGVLARSEDSSNDRCFGGARGHHSCSVSGIYKA